MIDSFTGQYEFLSNFYNVNFKFEGRIFHNSEAAYQSGKTWNKEEKNLMATLSPAEAKKMGRRVMLRPDWERIKDEYMYFVCYAKFAQNPDLVKLLLQTGDEELIEGNTWHDNYWGNCTCPKCKEIQGKNQLGKTLMKLRECFKSNLH